MRVVVINDFAYVNGGTAAVAVASAIGLARQGYQVSYFSAVGPPDGRLQDSGVEVFCAGQHEILKDPNRLRAACQGLWNRAAARNLALHLNGMDRENTIIHLHGWSKALSASVLRAAIDRGFKTVCTLHDYFAACPNGGFFDHRSLEHCHKRPLSFACLARNCDSRNYVHKLWRAARQVVQQRIGGLPGAIDAFVVISRLSCDILRPYLPKRAQLFEVPNPIDLPRQQPLEPERGNSFVMIGRLTLDKGGALLARAARECGVPAVFVGEGPCRQEIASAYPSATITGWVQKERVGGFLERARALVLPSLWYEAQPLVPLEAASRGVPAIVSDGCAGKETVQDGVTGVLFKNGDVSSLTSALRRMKDDQFVRCLGRAAYERYWANPLTTERHVARLEQVYQAVLGQRN
ncbi:MAG: glycosyltransferase [Acidobacteria bacterium]|nr:MAG: glycosyltransferase [Acidobacteriota bacterium]